jgi:hypothetical protein
MPFKRSAQRNPVCFRGFKVKRLMQRSLCHFAMILTRDAVETKIHNLNIMPNPGLGKIRDEEQFFFEVAQHHLPEFDLQGSP